jgi:hypothetical protein
MRYNTLAFVILGLDPRIQQPSLCEASKKTLSGFSYMRCPATKNAAVEGLL